MTGSQFRYMLYTIIDFFALVPCLPLPLSQSTRHVYSNTRIGHRPVNVKRALIGSKGGWKLSTIFLSCKVFHDWSIIKLGNILYLLNGYIFAVLFETTSHYFC